jgi:hypothetical protein
MIAEKNKDFDPPRGLAHEEGQMGDEFARF